MKKLSKELLTWQKLRGLLQFVYLDGWLNELHLNPKVCQFDAHVAQQTSPKSTQLLRMGTWLYRALGKDKAAERKASPRKNPVWTPVTWKQNLTFIEMDLVHL